MFGIKMNFPNSLLATVVPNTLNVLLLFFLQLQFSLDQQGSDNWEMELIV